jgi:uncharacterized membrane protein YfcA
MKLSEVFVLVAAGTAGGIFSTVVSIASLVTYPVLLALGVPPLSANMTNTVSLVFTGAGSVAGSRPELAGERSRVLRLAMVTALGGIIGAAILLVAPASTFTAIAPVLIGGASIVLLVQPRIIARRARHQDRRLATPPADQLSAPLADHRTGHWTGHIAVGRVELSARTPLIGLFCVAMYVGYFGAAAGVMLLVVLSTMIAEPLVKVNAIKNAVSGAANGMAAVCFAVFGSVRWMFVWPLAAGFLLGGWLGPKIVRRVPAQALRVIVSLCGVGLAVKLAWSAYH